MSCLQSLRDDAEDVKPHLRLYGNAASREYVTVQGLKGLKCYCLLYLIPQTY